MTPRDSVQRIKRVERVEEPWKLSNWPRKSINKPKSAKTRQRGSMKSNERKETLEQQQQRTSAVPEDLSRRAKTPSALTTLDSVTLDVNYLSRLVL